MRVAITGSSGLIGSALARSLEADGHETLRLVRRTPSGEMGTIPWDPRAGTIDRGALEGVDAVVHLAGESIAAGRWSAARKRAILESRTAGTRLLAETLASLGAKPRVLVSVSGVNYYGDRGAERIDESAPGGTGFLADVCRAWEAAADPAREASIRVVHPRLGLVLSARGGALPRMLPPFRLGIGGPMGSGRQYVCPVALEDVVRALRFSIDEERLAGAVNVTGPEPMTNAEFARALGRALRRPAILPVPAAAISLLFGEMGRELLLSSLRVVPAKLLAAGFRFLHPDLDSALRSVLKDV